MFDNPIKLYRTWAAVAVGVAGIATTAIGSASKRKQEKKLEEQANSYKPNESIMDYYNKALQRYSINPYNSAYYKSSKESAGQGLSQGLSYLQDRRSALGGVGSLVQGYNDSNQRAAANAEGMQAQALSQLGNAAGVKTQEDKYPFEMKYNLTSMKAGAANQLMNAGLTNTYNSIGSLTDRSMIDRYYGGTGNIFKYGKKP